MPLRTVTFSGGKSPGTWVRFQPRRCRAGSVEPDAVTPTSNWTSLVQQPRCTILGPTMAFGKCQGCEEYFESTSGEIPNFCPDCGAPVLERCPHCNFTLDELGFKPYLPYPEFCSNCGEWLFPKKAIGVPYLGFEPM